MRNKPRSPRKISTNKNYDLLGIKSYNELPVWYIGFPNDINLVLSRMNDMEQKLVKRGFRVPRPLQIFSLTIAENNVPMGKKTIKKAREPFTLLAVALEKDGD